VGGETIIESSQERLLGLKISCDLTWQEYIRGSGGLITAVRQRLLLLKRLSQVFPAVYLPSIADGLIMSKVRYCISVYGKIRLKEEDPISQEYKSIQVALNNVMRMLCKKKISDHVQISELLRLTGFLSFNQLAAQSILTLMWQINREADHPLKRLLARTTTMANMETRSSTRGDLELPGGSRLLRASFLHQAVQLWNMAPRDIRDSRTIGVMKKKIKSFVKCLPV
jgi:hypothetical protein